MPLAKAEQSLFLRLQADAGSCPYGLWQNASLLAKSESRNNPFELVEFTAKNWEGVTIKIKRVANRASSEKVLLGYAFVKAN